MDQGSSNYPKFQIHEKALSTTEIVCGCWKLSGTPKRDQSLFSLLLEIERRLRTEGRNNQIEQRKRSKEKDRQHSRANNLSRYCGSRYPLLLWGRGRKSQFPIGALPQHREVHLLSPLMLPIFLTKRIY